MNFSNIDSDSGSVELANGCKLYWKTGVHGGRIYFSDEVSPSDEGPICIWDSAIISGNTLLCALTIEKSLEVSERINKPK